LIGIGSEVPETFDIKSHRNHNNNNTKNYYYYYYEDMKNLYSEGEIIQD